MLFLNTNENINNIDAGLNDETDDNNDDETDSNNDDIDSDNETDSNNENNYQIINKDEADCVVYKEEGSEMLGNVFTLRSIRESFFNLSNTDLELLFREFNFFSEKSLFHLCISWFHKNRVFIKDKSIQPHGRITSFNNPNHIESVIFINPVSNLASMYLNNSSQYSKRINLYTGKGRNRLDISPFHWTILDLGEVGDLNFIDIYVNDAIVRKWDISSKEKIEKYVYCNKVEII